MITIWKLHGLLEHNLLEQVGITIGITTIAQNLTNSFTAHQSFVSGYSLILKNWDTSNESLYC
ncbi:MAG: hypothetical protein ACXVCP_17585 [Bdellovibrio sp.]